MEAISVCLAAALLLSTLLFLLSGRHRRRRNLLLPPTIPGAVPILGHLHLFIGPSRRQPLLHHTLANLSTAHGPVLLLRFGSCSVLSICSASAAEECLTVNDITFSNRPPQIAAKHLDYDSSTMVTSSYGPQWRNLRRLAAVELLSASRLQSLAHFLAEETRSLVRSLFSAAHVNSAEWSRAEVKKKLRLLSWSILTKIIDDQKDHGEVEKTVNSRVGERLSRLIEDSFSLSGVNVEDYLPLVRWLGLGGKERKMIKLGKELDEMFRAVVDETRQRRRSAQKTETPTTWKTIVEVMLELQEEEPEKYSDTIIKGMISAVLSAGIDTTSITMEWMLSLLLNHPKVLQKARDEIDSHIGGHDRLITDSDLPHLRHLQNIIKETLRLFPPAPLLLPHHSSADCIVAGYTIPSGTVLLINAYAIHRDPKLWKNPNNFIPERFDEDDGKGFRFLPFGFGRRMCPGKGLANLLVGQAIGTLIQCFEWKGVNGDEIVDLTEGEGVSTHKSVPLEALYKPREVMLPLLSQL